jgi:hypothetical protein
MPETWAITTEETNALRMFERKIVRKIHGPVKGELCGIRTNKEINDMPQGEDIVKFIKSRAAEIKYKRKTAGCNRTDYKTNTAITKELNICPSFGQNTGIQKKLVATYKANFP